MVWKGFQNSGKREDTLLVSLNCNENAFIYWALQYGPYVEVLEPLGLREKLVSIIAGMYNKYKDSIG